MIHSLKVGQLIYERLSSDTELVTKIGHVIPDSKKIFPLIADNETIFPFIVYTRMGVIPAKQTKDGTAEDNVNFQVTVCSDSYDEAVEVADMVRNLLEMKYIGDEEIAMLETYMSGCNESFTNNTYVQQLIFTTKVKNIYTPATPNEETQNS